MTCIQCKSRTSKFSRPHCLYLRLLISEVSTKCLKESLTIRFTLGVSSLEDLSLHSPPESSGRCVILNASNTLPSFRECSECVCARRGLACLLTAVAPMWTPADRSQLVRPDRPPLVRRFNVQRSPLTTMSSLRFLVAGLSLLCQITSLRAFMIPPVGGSTVQLILEDEPRQP